MGDVYSLVNEIEKRLKKHSEEKNVRIEKLKEILENREQCFRFIDGAIERIKNSKPKYIEGYELKIANERRKNLKIKSNNKYMEHDFWDIAKERENIKIDIILTGENKEITIGEIDCNVEWYGLSREKVYRVKINDICLYEDYQNKGYGTYILRHISSIISHLYEGKVSKVETTPGVIKHDKYKMHDTAYDEIIKNIEKWLKNNGYELSDREDDNKCTYEMEKWGINNIDDYIMEFESTLIDILKPYKYYKDRVISECNEILNIICKTKYSGLSKEGKILRLDKVKESINKAYYKLKEDNEYIISTIDTVKRLYDKVTLDELEINKDDKIDEMVMKLYCRYFTYAKVGTELERMGYTTKSKGTNEQRKYIARELQDIILNSDTKNEVLKEYANCLLIANKVS